MIKAFRDTWELGIHSYLTYLRDRLLLARELLSESGSIFVQISDENVHLVRSLMEEVFGKENFVALIAYKTTSGVTQALAPRRICDYIIWHAREKSKMKFRRLFINASVDTGLFDRVEDTTSGNRRHLTTEEKEKPGRISSDLRLFGSLPLHSRGGGNSEPRIFKGTTYNIPYGRHWSHTNDGYERLVQANRVIEETSVIRSVFYYNDFPYEELTAYWDDTGPELQKTYSVQTSPKPITRCVLMTTDPGDLVFDPTCGSGTTAYVAEQWGRRWVTCDTSRVALTLAKQRLMTALYDYYELAHLEEGVSSGFKYKAVPHITLKSIANNEPPGQETLYDQPFVDNSKSRVSGPFTVEAVPAPVVKPLAEIEEEALPADESISRSGETLRQAEWRDELLKTGFRGKRGQYIIFSRVESLPGTRWLHADAETRPNDRGADSVRETRAIYKEPQRVVISFGPEHAPLNKVQVERAIEEAQTLVPKPRIIVFASFQFDPEAAKDIDETDWPGVTLLKAQMNADLLTEDLKRKRVSNESFWLIGQPDVRMERISEGKYKGKYQVEVLGFDYYNTKTGSIESGGTANIAMWLLDTDYDGRSLFPRQVFFPMAGEKEGWSRLARNLKAEIDEELIEAYRGTVSLPFEPGENRRVVVKIVDDRGIESLKIIEVE